jgi:glycosyltransferase involved in cell wall biosynthesis
MTPVTPFFSIIIPTYNSEKTLERCLDSILAQRFSNFEILIVDGLSSDQTVEIARGKNDPRIRIFSEKDRGVYDAMNKGIDLARGAWLLFLGSDDRLFDEFVLECAQGHLINAKAELVYGNTQVVGDTLFAEDGSIYDGEFSVSKLFMKNICHQSILYSKKIFSRVGYYDTKYPVCADWDLNLRCFASGTAQYYDKVITLFSGGGASSGTQDNFTFEERRLKIKEYFGYGLLNRHFEIYEGAFLGHAAALFARKKPLEAFRYWALYFYHTKNKTRALKDLAVTLFG